MEIQDCKSRDQIIELIARIKSEVIGQENLINGLVIALLADGNILIEGMPGLAKTRSIKIFSKNINLNLSRIQFTPDLLPSDITGTEMYLGNKEGNLKFQEGPIFNNIILADEINRAPSKVQSALLEAMQERQVTVLGNTYKLPKFFMVLATQNPQEQEGTYRLPEAQMDRFLMNIKVDYPNVEEELEILHLIKKEEKQNIEETLKPLNSDIVDIARKEIKNIVVSENIEKYIVQLIIATRIPYKYSEKLEKWIQSGVSPRATIALEKCSRVSAWLDRRDYVIPNDIRQVIGDVLRHRIQLKYEANAEGITKDDVISELLNVVSIA
ncbi:MoxR family ATPase [Marinilabiliaceae bacterium JC040]|nr:MoxR family ATPase [Marinilabiliaceae bacterium JC040]